jgi:hypothetical protein
MVQARLFCPALPGPHPPGTVHESTWHCPQDRWWPIPQLDVAPSFPPATCLGTWNEHNLNTQESLSRLVALSQFMHYLGVGALTVQESRLPPNAPLAAVAGLLYFRSAPILQSHTRTQRSREPASWSPLPTVRASLTLAPATP